MNEQQGQQGGAPGAESTANNAATDEVQDAEIVEEK
jgi:hypothetical protein